MSTFEDPTRPEKTHPTQAIPEVVEPAKPVKTPREPLDPEDFAFLVGILGVASVLILGITAWVFFTNRDNEAEATQKAHQVEACAKMPDGTSAYACVTVLAD